MDCFVKCPLVTKFLSNELIEFLGDFVIEPAVYSKSFALRCKDGRYFYSNTTSGLLDEVEKAYNEHLKSKDWSKDAVSEKSS